MKREKNKIYGALGEYIINGDSTLLNDEQLKIANQHKEELKRKLNKVKKEKQLIKVGEFIRKIPSYIFYGISNTIAIFITPFMWIAHKCDNIAVKYETKIYLNSVKPIEREKFNKYAYNIVLPLLEEAETDDMVEKQRKWMTKKALMRRPPEIKNNRSKANKII